MFSSFFPLLSPTYIFQQISMNRFFLIIGCCNNPPSFSAPPGLVTTPWSKSLIFLEIFSGFQEILSPPYFYLSPNCIDFGTLEQQRHKRSIPASVKSHFHSTPPTRGVECTSQKSVSLFVCHMDMVDQVNIFRVNIIQGEYFEYLIWGCYMSWLTGRRGGLGRSIKWPVVE